MYLPVILGTERRTSTTAGIAQAVAERLQASGVESRVLSPSLGNLEHAHWEGSPPSEALAAFKAEAARADGFVLAFPEYNFGYPGSLKNALDHLYAEWAGKPFAFVSVGGISGGMRAQENLLPIIRGIRGVAINANVAVHARDGVYDNTELGAPLDALVSELTLWAQSLRAVREPSSGLATA